MEIDISVNRNDKTVGRCTSHQTPDQTPQTTQYSPIYADTPFFALAIEEFQLRNDKQKASGLSKTDYLVQAIRSSEVRIYSIEESFAPLIHEIRKIGTNLNQLAYFSNIGQDEKVRSEICAIRRENEIVMKKILVFLNNPKFTTGSKK